jgi:hypothetical protein
MHGLTGLVAVVGGILLFLVPIAGLTARFALKPLVDSVARAMQARQPVGDAGVERRLFALEQEVSQLRGDLQRLSDGRDFDRKLASSSADAVTAGS